MSVIINGSNTPTAGSAAIGNGTELAFTAAGTSGQVLTSQGASSAIWSAVALAASSTLTTPTITGLIEVKTAPAIASGVLTLNCALGNVFAVSLNAAITSLTFSNIPTGAYSLTLAFTCDGTARAVTWPASVKWSGGTAPTLTSTLNKVDIFVLNVWDGTGTTWYAMTGGQNH